VANVGSSVRRIVALVMLATLLLALAGCNSGTITSEQITSKEKALHEVAKKKEGPNFVDRGQ
jgi:hypothetical protein